MAPVNKQVFFFLSPRHCGSLRGRFFFETLLRRERLRGLQVPGRRQQKLAPVIKQVFFFLSPQHCAIGKARFLAYPLCGSHIQSALPLFRKAGFSEVKGKLNSAKRYYGLGAYGGYKSLASANKYMAPVDNRCFYFYHPATALSAKHDFWLIRSADCKYNRLCLFSEKQAFRQ